MATFSLGTSGVTPGAPGVYINEQPGKLANAAIASFSTVYMLVETEEDVPVTRFPFNKPIKISSLNDYKELIRIGTSTVPDTRIPLLSYNCVNEFFQNAQVGDLRVVRVGSPNQIVEIEFFPSGSKLNSTDLPSALMAGNKVFVQMTINGQKLVAGDGSTGYTASGEWLGVPVEIPVNYVAGDEVNNRKISAAIAAAVAEAIETNPAIRSSVYVRDFGMINDLDPASNSQNSYVSIAATTFDGNVSVVTEVFPVGSNFVFMQNTYDIGNIVGLQTALERVPQDYAQCINTAFDGVQDQGYLVTPTAYAQFDAKGRAYIGATAAAHCENNNFKWMALADPGPYLVTDVNKYKDFVPHKAAADLITGFKYLVDNAIYQWVGDDVTYNKLSYQTMVFGESAETAINESANVVSSSTQVGLLDNGQYTINAVPSAIQGVFQLDTDQWWPVTLPILRVTLTGANIGNDFQSVSIQGQPGTFNLNSTEVYVIAPPYNTLTDSEYSLNNVFLATTAADASNIYNAVVLAGGSVNITTPPNGAVYLGAPTGDAALLTYADPYWDLPVTINGQTSDLIENITDQAVGVNTLHLPGTLQDPTETYRLFWTSRTIYNAAISVASYSGTVTQYTGNAAFNVVGHGLRSGQKVYFTQPIVMTAGTLSKNLVNQTTKLVGKAYWVKVIDANTFVLANSLNNYTIGSFISIPAGYTISAFPTIFYSQILGGGETTVTPYELLTVPLIRARKYEFDSSTIFNQAADSSVAPGMGAATDPGSSIFLNNASLILGEDQITPYGEDLSSVSLCGWLPELNLVNPTTTFSPVVTNAYCVPTVDQFFQPEAYFVPSIDPIFAGTYDASAFGTTGPIVQGAAGVTGLVSGPGPFIDGTYYNVPLTGGSGFGAQGTVVVAGTAVTSVAITAGGGNYVVGDVLTVGTFTGSTVNVAAIEAAGLVAASSPYALAAGQANGDSGNDLVAIQSRLVGVYYDVIGANTQVGTLGTLVQGAGYTAGTYLVPAVGGTGTGATLQVVVGTLGTVTSVSIVDRGTGYTVGDVLTAPTLPLGAGFSITVSSVVAGETPDGLLPVVVGDRIALTYDGSTYKWVVVPAASLGGDLTSVGQPCYNSQIELVFTPEQVVPATLWRFDAITPTEIIDRALRGVGFNGDPQAVFIEAGIDNVNRLYDDSQRYFNPFGFIAYYGPYIENGAGQFIPPSPYVTGVAVRRYRSEGYQFPPAGVKYQLADAVGVQIPINSAQQNLLNPDGCNAVRTLPGYPQTSVFIWGGRTRVNAKDAQQRLYQFVNTRVILNVVYGSLRSAFDSQIFNVIDGFGIVYNQIISVGNSILNQLYVKGALFGARPSDAFQVICDARINPPEDIENGIVNAKVFVTPVPTLERIQIDLIRVAIGKMQQELDIQGLGQSNQ